MYKPAGVMIRGVAFILDIFITAILGQVITGVCFLRANIESSFMVYLIICMSVSFVIVFCSEIVSTSTLGKYVFGLVLINNKNDRSITKLEFLIHSLLKLIWIVDGFVIAFSKVKRGIGNIASKTNTVWNEDGIKKRLIRIGIAVIVVGAIFESDIILNGILYSRTDIYQASQMVISNVIANGNDKNIGGIKKYNYPPIQVQIKNTDGLVVLKYLDSSNREKYLELEFAKNNNRWKYVRGETIEKKPSTVYSISYSLK